MIKNYYVFDGNVFVQLNTQTKHYLLKAYRDTKTKEINMFLVGRKFITNYGYNANLELFNKLLELWNNQKLFNMLDNGLEQIKNK